MTMVVGAVTSVATFLNASSTILAYFRTAKQQLPVTIIDHLRNLTDAPKGGAAGACPDTLLELRPINHLTQPWSAYLADITTVQDILSKRRRGWLEGLVSRIDSAVANAQQEVPLRGGPRGIFLTGPEGSMLTRWMHRVWHDSIASSAGAAPPAQPAAADGGDGDTTCAAPAGVQPNALPPVTLVFDYAAQSAFAALDAACVQATLDNSVRYALASTARRQRGTLQQQRGAPAAANDGDRLPPVILYMPHLTAAALGKLTAVVQQLAPTYVVIANTHNETAVQQATGALTAARVHLDVAPSLQIPVLGSAIISALAPDNHAIMMRADTLFHYCKPSVSCLMMVGIAAKHFPRQSNDFLRFMKASSATPTQTGDKLMAMLAVGTGNTAYYGKLCAIFMHDELPVRGGPHDDEYRASAADVALEAGAPTSEPAAAGGTFAPCLPERVITAWFADDDVHEVEDFMEQLRAEGLWFVTAEQRCTRLVKIPWARQLVDDWITHVSTEAQARAWSRVVDAVAEEVSTGSLTSAATAASVWTAAVRHGGGTALSRFFQQLVAAMATPTVPASAGGMRIASRGSYQAHAASAVSRAVRIVAAVTAMAGQNLLGAAHDATIVSDGGDAQVVQTTSADFAPFTSVTLAAAASPVVSLAESLALQLTDSAAMQAAIVACSAFRLRYALPGGSVAAFERLNATLAGDIGAEACGVWARVLVTTNHHAAAESVLSYCIQRTHHDALAAAVHRAVHGVDAASAPSRPPVAQMGADPAAIAALRRDRALVRLALHLGHALNRQKLGDMAADWIRAALVAAGASGSPSDASHTSGDLPLLQLPPSCAADDAHGASSCAQGAVSDMARFIDDVAGLSLSGMPSSGSAAAMAAADDLRAALLGLSAALQVAGRAADSRDLLVSLLGGLSGTAPTAFKVQLLCGAFAAQVFEGRQPEEHVQAAHTACSAVASDAAGGGGSHNKPQSADVGFFFTSPKITTAASIVEGLLAS